MNKKSEKLKFRCYYETPIGLLLIEANQMKLESISFVDERVFDEIVNSVLQKTKNQLNEYFNGTRREFSLPLKYVGTNFQIKVWRALEAINYGHTASYKVIAERIKHSKAYRAVGSANNKNPLPIIIPCHRVIGSNGSLTGYAGGIWRKSWLLSHEKKILEGDM